MASRKPTPDRRSRQVVQQDQSRESAPYDGYPDRPLSPPRVRLYLVAFEEIDGTSNSFDGEIVDTDGLSAREWLPGLSTDGRRKWLARRIVEANDRLLERIDQD